MGRRYVCGFRPSGAGAGTAPMASIYGIASRGGYLREVGVFNTTTTAWAMKLARLTTAGTVGAGQTEGQYNTNDDANDLTVFDVHTFGPTIGTTLRQATIGAAAGAGVIFTFAEPGILIPSGTTNGIGIVSSTGTPQISDVYFEWEE